MFCIREMFEPRVKKCKKRRKKILRKFLATCLNFPKKTSDIPLIICQLKSLHPAFKFVVVVILSLS